MGIQITRLTAHEIFANPRDLAIAVLPMQASSKFALLFMRGPGHNFKSMITVVDIPSREEAVRVVHGLLDTTLNECERFRGDHDLCLDRELVNRIIATLEESSTANTYEFAAA
jgi:hypothetical protein